MFETKYNPMVEMMTKMEGKDWTRSPKSRQSKNDGTMISNGRMNANRMNS